MQVHILNYNRLKLILFFGILLFSVCRAEAQNPVGLCKVSIYIDAIKSGMSSLEQSSDTVNIKESDASYLRIRLNSCKGAMYIERRLRSDSSIVFSGNYVDAVKLDTVESWAIDPMTGERNRRITTHYKPLRTGVWKYYNAKGELLKEEEYLNGKLIPSKKQ